MASAFATSIHAQTGLSVSVHCDEPGTLFVMIMLILPAMASFIMSMKAGR